LSLAFQPSQPGQQQGQLTLQTNVGPHTIQLLGQASLSPPQLSVAESELDFGLLEALGQKKLVLELANQGGQPLEISSLQIEPAEPFTSATTVPLMVAGNQDEPIELVFGPQEDGLFEARLTIDSNGGQLELELSGQRALLPPVAHSLQILLASDQLPANGMASSQLLITVYAEDGRLVKDETIQLSASSGEIEAEVTYQDEAYQATYTAGTVVGEVMLTAQTSNSKTATTSLNLQSRQLSVEDSSLSSDKPLVLADGQDQAQLEINPDRSTGTALAGAKDRTGGYTAAADPLFTLHQY